GNADAPDILFVGEGPGADEDAQGRPFVGRAGKLLDKMIVAMGYRREQVFIANVVKCRPPDNRKPVREEMDLCLPYLRHQIALIRPRVIVGLGGTAMEGLLGNPVGITRMRGVWQEYAGIKLMPTYHPSYLLRDPSKKKDVWADLKLVLAELGKKPPR
ncbi:MAG: uracil-DNA glycosylase, partial [Pontiella sp.]|nr:uracil-DNA glycosylase [Pontiella sp.]